MSISTTTDKLGCYAINTDDPRLEDAALAAFAQPPDILIVSGPQQALPSAGLGASVCIDCLSLPNPYSYNSLRLLDGFDPQVQAWSRQPFNRASFDGLMERAGTKIRKRVGMMVPGERCLILVTCHGGHHRSPLVGLELTLRLMAWQAQQAWQRVIEFRRVPYDENHHRVGYRALTSDTLLAKTVFICRSLLWTGTPTTETTHATETTTIR